MSRLPLRPISQLPRKQLQRYAYYAIERQMMGDPEGQDEASNALTRLTSMLRVELVRWAVAELDYRVMGEP